jgi:hypothetical protein
LQTKTEANHWVEKYAADRASQPKRYPVEDHEGADGGFDQAQNIDDRRYPNSDGRSAANVWLAEWATRSYHVVL